MAGDVEIDVNSPLDVHDEMPFRLGDIVLEKRFGDLHPSLDVVDKVRLEWKFQFRLLFKEWGQPQYITMLTGIFAFLLGSISTELYSGGDPQTSGINGFGVIGGFSFFQLIVSTILWIWFFIQLSVNFPIMRGHIINVIIIWGSIFLSLIVLHVNSPNFPIGATLGDALGGTILAAVGLFFTYFFWKAVTETRDLHVKEHHLHTDVRVMEEAMAEHSLFSWTILVFIWIFTIIINAWAGAHFIADRLVEDYTAYVIHLISGIILIYLLMHILWFPQRMLGDGTRVQTRAAAAADADLLYDGVVLASEGECPSCNSSAPVSQNNDGDIVVDCASDDCNSRGTVGSKCEGCNEKYPSRHTCSNCGVNSPVADFIPDSEAW